MEAGRSLAFCILWRSGMPLQLHHTMGYHERFHKVQGIHSTFFYLAHNLVLLPRISLSPKIGPKTGMQGWWQTKNAPIFAG